MGNDINESKLVGGKRKNGHKFECTCHICENMKNKAKRGGYEEEMEKEKEKMMGGSKKKNGHRKACRCPICKNMSNSKKIGGNKSSRRSKKKRGGSDEDGYEEEKTESEEKKDELPVPYDDDSSSDEEEEKKNGRKKNGHKAKCKCPICNNMKKKGGEPNLENKTGDIEETTGSDNSSVQTGTEIKASDSDYDALDSAERGEVGIGGTRKKRKGGKKWGGKTKKTRRNRNHS